MSRVLVLTVSYGSPGENYISIYMHSRPVFDIRSFFSSSRNIEIKRHFEQLKKYFNRINVPVN